MARGWLAEAPLVRACDLGVRRVTRGWLGLGLMWQDLLQKEFLLESRQIKLLSELQAIYPIERLENQEFAIRGLELPVDVVNTTKDDEHISSALGYLCHLVFMLSKYLQVGRALPLAKKRLPVEDSRLLGAQVPLRFVLDYRSSRSQVKDAALDAAVYPLYRKGPGGGGDRFERAVALLEKDIQQLLYARGVKFRNEAHMLQNLQTLFTHEMCPKVM
jgi:hypothetical protein